MGELLDLARQLRPTALDDHGLVAALDAPTCASSTGAATARASFWADPALGDLSPDAQVVVYRVAQEALVNAARHSGRDPHRGEPRAARLARPAAGRRQRLGLRLRRGGQGARPLRHARARAARGRHARDRLAARARARPSSSRCRPEPAPTGTATCAAADRGRVKILIADDHGIVRSGREAAARPPARHGGGRRGRGRRRRAREGGRSTSRTSPCSTSRCRA